MDQWRRYTTGPPGQVSLSPVWNQSLEEQDERLTQLPLLIAGLPVQTSLLTATLKTVVRSETTGPPLLKKYGASNFTILNNCLSDGSCLPVNDPLSGGYQRHFAAPMEYFLGPNIHQTLSEVTFHIPSLLFLISWSSLMFYLVSILLSPDTHIYLLIIFHWTFISFVHFNIVMYVKHSHYFYLYFSNVHVSFVVSTFVPNQSWYGWNLL